MNTWNITTISDDAAGLTYIAPQITALASTLLTAVEDLENIQCAWELFDKLPSVGRSVVQVHVNTAFFETFFNSADGYRAMFRRGPFIGSVTNAALVRAVMSSLSVRLPESMNVQVTKNLALMRR